MNGKALRSTTPLAPPGGPRAWCTTIAALTWPPPAMRIGWRMQLFPVYLTIVPLFHCNGWCHAWMIPMLGGTVVCCRDVTAKAIYDAIADEGVTHFGGAPIVLNTMINCKPEDRRSFSHTVEVFTAGAPPPAATLAAFEPLGLQRHASLRADRNLRPRHRMSVANRMGCRHRRRPLRAEGPHRRCHGDAGRGRSCTTATATPSPATARIWARSPCAAIW